MSRRKNKNNRNRQSAQPNGNRDGQSTELLSELSSLRDLLDSDELGDIPLLDQIAAPGTTRKPAAPLTAQPRSQSRQEPPALLDDTLLDDIDPPVLFSPVDESLTDEQPLLNPGADLSAELSETDRALLRPLQNLPTEKPRAEEETSAQKRQEDLFEQPSETVPKAAENPFLPPHIRARLTGGRVPRAEVEEETTVPEPQRESPHPAHEPEGAAEPPESEADEDTTAEERQRLRQQLIDRLVAKELPELERRLRARIELMVDELDDWD